MIDDRGPGPAPDQAEAALAAGLFDPVDRPRLRQLADLLARLHAAEQQQAVAPLRRALETGAEADAGKLLDGLQSLLKGTGFVAREDPLAPALAASHEAEPLATWLARRRLAKQPVRLYARGAARVLIRRPLGAPRLLVERYRGIDDATLLAGLEPARRDIRLTAAGPLALVAVALATATAPAPIASSLALSGALGLAAWTRRPRPDPRAERLASHAASGSALLLQLAQELADRRSSETLLAYGALWLNGPKRRSELEAIVARLLDRDGGPILPLAGALATLARLGLIEPDGPGFVPLPFAEALASLRERWSELASR